MALRCSLGLVVDHVALAARSEVGHGAGGRCREEVELKLIIISMFATARARVGRIQHHDVAAFLAESCVGRVAAVWRQKQLEPHPGFRNVGLIVSTAATVASNGDVQSVAVLTKRGWV